MGKLHESRENIKGSWSALQDQWADVRHQWRDSISNRFEREWWLPIEQAIPRLLEVMAELDDTLDSALQDTED